MTHIIEASNKDELSGFITATFVSQTYKVETTHSIVDIWDDVRKNVSATNNLEYVAAILALGRIMDLNFELQEDRFVNMMNELISTLVKELEKHGHVNDISDTSFITAFLTSAYISRSERIETLNEIVNRWEAFNSKFKIKDDIDKIASILAIGRIKEFKYSISNINLLLEVFDKLKEEVSKILAGRDVEQKDVAAALLTSAYLEITPKVEKIHDIVVTWEGMLGKVTIKDHIDYVSAILAYGRIQDLTAQFMITDGDLLEIKDNIKEVIKTKF